MQPTTLIATAGLALAIACNPIAPEVSESEQVLVRQEFTASFELSSGTRTSLSGTDVLWDADGEAIDIVCQNGSIYTANQTAVSQDSRTASFSGDVPQTGKLFAVYPEGLCSGYSNGLLSVSVPSFQTAVADGFSSHTAPMVAKVVDGETMHMRNLCGMIGFRVSNSGIKSIAFSATESGGCALTGSGQVRYDGSDPVCNASSGLNEVVLEGDIQPGGLYWALVYPGTYTNLKVVFTDNDGRTATFSKDGTLEISRSKARRISTFTISDADWDGGGQSLQTATLTFEEASDYVNGYGKPTSYTNEYGTWTICAYKEKAFQLNKNKVAYIGTPLMQGVIQSVSITLASGSNSSGTFYICSSTGDNNAPAGSMAASCAGTQTDIDVSSLGLKQLWIRSSFGVKISQITIIWLGSGGSNPATPVVTTQAATGVGMADATLNASFSCIPTNPDPTAAFFRWGTSVSALTNELYDTQTILNSSSGTFSALLTGLEEGKTYYYQAVMTLANGTDVEGEVMSFTTRSAQQSNAPGYLACYEVPAVDVSGSVTSGAEKYGYKWYKYYTPNSKRAVATHTVQYNGKVIRNYTVMMDADKKSPVWCATAFNTGTWPDNNVGRTGSWTSDPAFPASWQQENGTGVYGKGHLIASNYRQTSTETNKQTFYTTNQAAQYQTKFNDGIWNVLEQKVAASAPSGRDTLYVVVGILFEGTTTVTDGIYIPSHFYKCLMKCSFNASGVMTAATGCAYLFENKQYSNTSYNSYKTTIDAIEERTGLDFFHNVPDDLENAAESAAGSPI